MKSRGYDIDKISKALSENPKLIIQPFYNRLLVFDNQTKICLRTIWGLKSNPLLEYQVRDYLLIIKKSVPDLDIDLVLKKSIFS